MEDHQTNAIVNDDKHPIYINSVKQDNRTTIAKLKCRYCPHCNTGSDNRCPGETPVLTLEVV